MTGLLISACLIALAQGNSLSRIINGHDTSIADHPHQISLQYLSGGQWYHICGGSILAETWIITAAHCVETATAAVLQVHLNDGNIKDTNAKAYAVDAIIMHPDYNRGRGAFPNDVALLRLKTAADLSGANKAVALASASDNFDGQTCVVSGWGHTDTGTQENKPIPEVLQETSGAILTDSQCGGYWGTNYQPAPHICIHNPETGTCQGDSGGPMICTNSNGVSVLAGVTSWGVAGCATTYPSVYARLTTYRAWLDATMRM